MLIAMVKNDFAARASHRAMWLLGDYPKVAREVLAPLGRELVEACRVGSGQRVLDVAAGSGNAAIPAAEAGAAVVASDLAPEFLAIAGREAASRGVRLREVEADAEALPFEDGEFDVVMSCIGAIFAQHHRQVADEMLRVCRPGGTIGMVNWAAEGSIADFLQVFAPYLPPPAPGASPPVRWGDAAYVRDLFGNRVEGLTMSPTRSLRVDHFTEPAEFCAYYKTHFGPTIATYAGIAAEPERVAALDRDFLAYAQQLNKAPEGSPAVLGYDYVVVTARKR
jgi:SAM-dependent methyltransferase